MSIQTTVICDGCQREIKFSPKEPNKWIPTITCLDIAPLVHPPIPGYEKEVYTVTRSPDFYGTRHFCTMVCLTGWTLGKTPS